MSLEEFTVQKNTGHVEQGVGGMSEGQLADIERRAKAQVIEGERESKKAAAAEESSAKASTTEGKVYGDLALDAIAPGARAMKSVIDFIGAREEDKRTGLESADAQAVTGASKARHIDHDIKQADRRPGMYRHDVGSKIYEKAIAKGDISTEKSKPGEHRFVSGDIADKITPVGKESIKLSKVDGEDLMSRAALTKSSLGDQPEGATETWKGTEEKIAGVKQAKELTFGARNANELALQSVQKARELNAGMQYQAQQMAPQMSMMNGPSIKVADLLREAREESGQQSV